MFAAHLMGTGPFFDDLIALLCPSAFTATRDALTAADSTNWPQALVQVLVTPGRDHHAEKLLEDFSWGSGRAWIPVQLEARSVRVGPVIVPRRTSCLSCFDRRQEQHGRRSATDRSIELAQDGLVTFTGYAPSHTKMIAVVLESITRSADDLVDAASSVWRFGFSDLTVKQFRVIPVSGCGRCDSTRQDKPRSSELAKYFVPALGRSTP